MFWPLWPKGCVFIYELSACGVESRRSQEKNYYFQEIFSIQKLKIKRIKVKRSNKKSFQMKYTKQIIKKDKTNLFSKF